MKRILLFFATLMLSANMWAQQVFTVVYATSDDGFVNVRRQPSTKAPVLTKLYTFSHGLGQGVLRGKSGKWSKVSVGNITGWAYTKYLGTQDWYNGQGHDKLVAIRNNTPIYSESFEDGSKHPLFTTVSKGTIIADEYNEEGEYYVLVTAHDYLFVKKKDVKVVSAF